MINVIGLGYIGLPTALMLASHGQEVVGTDYNAVTNFGAFVDIGVHQDGLVHISQMANRRIAHPTDVVKLHQHIRVRVIEVDHRRNRISLSMKGLT